MSKMVKRSFALLGFLSLLMLLAVSVSFAQDEADTAAYGTPELGADDLLWESTMEHTIDQRTDREEGDEDLPESTGTARILWDEGYVYARVEVEDEDVYTGNGPDHEYDSVEFYLGGGNSGANQWRVSAMGVWSGQTGEGRARYTELTEDGYIVEVRLPRRDLVLEEGPLTFEIYINNSTSAGGDRYEVVSAFGAPDTGFNSDAAFEDALTLVEAEEVDARFAINITAGSGGRVTPNAPGNVLRVSGGESVTFEFTPEVGQVVDVVTVDGEEVGLDEDGTYTLEDISADHAVQATFVTDPGADIFNFVVWNDNFADGEYTTAAIIDLGEGNAVNGEDLSSDLFAVAAHDTTQDGSDAFEGARRITRVYANDEPTVRGYLGTEVNSPDYQEGLDSGRYIVIEFEFFTETGGLTTLGINNSNSTIQNYDVVQTGDLTLADGSVRDNVAFDQANVVNPILDRFTTDNYNTFNYAQYLHRDGNGEVVQGLPLFIYAHGSTRGGTNAEVDQKAAMKSANGAVALMKKMDENPDQFASHILNVSSSSNHPDTADVKVIIDQMIEDGLVDANRIYMSGFSMGAGYTNSMMSAYPGMLAAAVPLAGGDGPSAADDEAHLNSAYWALVNYSDHAFLLQGVEDFVAEDGGFHTLDKALVSFFETNEVFVWPYNQYDQPQYRPPMEGYVGHEIEPSVLYNRLNESAHDWSVLPDHGTLDGDYEYLLEWIFDQSLEGEDVEPEPAENEIRDTVTVDAIEEIIEAEEPYRVESEDDSLVAELPVELLKQLTSASLTGSFTIEAEIVDEETLPTLEGTNKLSTFYDFNLLVGSAEYVSEFQEPITLTFSIDADDVTNPNHLRLVYIDNDGEVEYHAIESYNSETGVVTVKVDHFSVYGIAELDAEEVIGELEEQISDLTERLEELEDIRAEDAAEYAQEIADLRAQIEELQESEDALFDEMAALLARVEALENRVSELEEVEEDPAGDPEEDPEETEDPAEDSEDADETDSGSTESDSSDELPATATNNFNMMLIGLVLLIVGGIAAVIVRKKRQKAS